MLRTYISKYKIGQTCRIKDYNLSGEIQAVLYSNYDINYKIRLDNFSVITSQSNNIEAEKNEIEYSAYSIDSTLSVDNEYFFFINGKIIPCSITGVEFFRVSKFKSVFLQTEEPEESEIKCVYRILVNNNMHVLSSVLPSMILTKEEAIIKQREFKLNKI
jgi:hypothetical protein